MLGISSRSVRTSVDDEHRAVRERDELAHSSSNGEIIVLDVDRVGAIGRFGRDGVAVVGSGVVESVDDGERIVTPLIVCHVGTAAEENGGSVVVGRGEREHGCGTGGGIDTDDLVWHVWKVGFRVGRVVPEDYRQPPHISTPYEDRREAKAMTHW